MLSFRQIFVAVPAEQRFEGVQQQSDEQLGDPVLLELDLLSCVSGGAKQGADSPGGGW